MTLLGMCAYECVNVTLKTGGQSNSILVVEVTVTAPTQHKLVLISGVASANTVVAVVPNLVSAIATTFLVYANA
jgi:hypothetical protein